MVVDMQLGLNYGGGNGSTKEICVRLRPASDRHSFLPLGSLLQTMLHELTHNHISPHDATFYAMLAEMEKVAFLSTHLSPPPSIQASLHSSREDRTSFIAFGK